MSFPPLEGKRARLLILGTMPGQISLTAQRYYAHERNAFWPIMMSFCDVLDGQVDPADAKGFGTLPDYATRVARLLCHGIAVWDVLAECERPGSLDANIRRDTERANDLPGFCARHPELDMIAFNGKAAETLFSRHVDLAPSDQQPSLARIALPSTSPAHAAMRPEEKRRRWHDALSIVWSQRG